MSTALILYNNKNQITFEKKRSSSPAQIKVLNEENLMQQEILSFFSYRSLFALASISRTFYNYVIYNPWARLHVLLLNPVLPKINNIEVFVPKKNCKDQRAFIERMDREFISSIQDMLLDKGHDTNW